MKVLPGLRGRDVVLDFFKNYINEGEGSGKLIPLRGASPFHQLFLIISKKNTREGEEKPRLTSMKY